MTQTIASVLLKTFLKLKADIFLNLKGCFLTQFLRKGFFKVKLFSSLKWKFKKEFCCCCSCFEINLINLWCYEEINGYSYQYQDPPSQKGKFLQYQIFLLGYWWRIWTTRKTKLRWKCKFSRTFDLIAALTKPQSNQFALFIKNPVDDRRSL